MQTTRQQAQREWDRHRSKTRFQLRLTVQTRTALLATAQSQQVPACELAERYIRNGLEREGAQHLEASALPQLEELLTGLVDKHTQQTENRLAKLLVRAIIASDTTRRLLYASMAKQWDVTQVQQVHTSARTAAINALRDREWSASLALQGEEKDL